MISGLSIGSELKRFGAGRLPRAALVILVLMPLLYSALYLTAFWDPFAKTSVLPVAVVNDDLGTTVDGERLEAGQKVVDELKTNHDLDWRVVDGATADQGLADHTYHFVVRILPGFSEAVASPNGDTPHQAQMSVTYDQSGNYLSSLIGRNASSELHNAVASAISQQTVDKVLVSVQEAGDGVHKAADGAKKIDDGAGTLDTGLAELASKTRDLDTGAKKLDTGAGTLADGAHTLATNLHTARTGADTLAGGIDTAADGASQLDAGIGRLQGGVGRLADGASQVSGGVDRLVGTLDTVGAAQSQAIAPLRQTADRLRAVEATTGSTGSTGVPLSAQLDQLADQLETQGLGPKSTQASDLHRLRDGAAQLAAATGPRGELQTGIGQLADGAHRLDTGLGQLSTGGHTLADGMGKLDDGAARLDTGAGTLHTGIGDLSAGTGKAVDGTAKLADGGHRLKGGTAELAGKLDEGAQKAPTWSDDHRKDMSRTIGDPVSLTSMSDHPAKTFGYGFAPFFIPLALFVGGIMIWLLLKPLQTRAVGTRLHPLRVVFASLEPAALIAVGQAAVILLVLRFGLGLSPVHPLGALGIMALSSAAFVSLIQMLNIVFGPSVGRVLSMALLMLQLTSADGIYPTAVEPAFFRWIHPFNPMTYTVEGLRQTIMGGAGWQIGVPVVVLAAITAGSITVSALAAYRDRVWTLERLHPPVAV